MHLSCFKLLSSFLLTVSPKVGILNRNVADKFSLNFKYILQYYVIITCFIIVYASLQYVIVKVLLYSFMYYLFIMYFCILYSFRLVNVCFKKVILYSVIVF